MSSLIEENAFNSLNSQISGGSRSSILLSHVEFKNVEEEDTMSTKVLQTKYNVLTNDSKFSFNTNNNSKDLVIKMNGQNNKISSNTNLVNGNSSEDTDGIPAPKYVLFPPERVLLEWKESRPIGAGLINLGNTCFLNSVLQSLTYCPPLVNYLLHSNDHNFNKCNNSNQFCMVCEMWRHLRQIRNNGDPVKPINICRRLKSIAKHFTFGRQEDAHEFLRYVIDNMWKSCLNNSDVQNQKLEPLSKETTAINQIFGGYHRSQVICFECKAKSNTYDYFMDFMLDIKSVNSLEKALDKFVAPEILQKEEAYKCNRCKSKVLARKQFTVFKAPNVATFQFKRFDYNRMFGGKINKPISYPEQLDLRPYMSEKGAPILYKLSSVLVHLGPTCNSGHYFCYVRNSNNSWYLMDDSRVIQTNQNSALNQGQAYVLFYVRIDTDFHRPAPKKTFISQTTPNGIRFSNISSPELIRNQKLNNFGTINVKYSPTQIPAPRKNNSGNDGFSTTPKNPQTDAIKQTQNSERKANNCSTKTAEKKGLVPYATDSSDDESPKHTNHLNGNLNPNCDKNLNNSKLSNEFNSNQSQKICRKVERVDTISNVKTNAIQPIPSPKLKINLNAQDSLTNITSEANCVPLAPITLKVKATTSSWHVVETALRSPSIASNSSTNSVNSTTEWNVSDGKPNCNGKHSKHKHKNKQCMNTANGNALQVLSTKEKIPQFKQLSEEEYKSGVSNRSNDYEFQSRSLKSETTRNTSQNNGLISETIHGVDSSIESKLKENHLTNGNQRFDRKRISSSRSSSDSQKEEKRMSKERDRSHSKSIQSDESTGSAHKHEKRKHRSTESETKEEKIKHKKKKKKKQKHKRKERSDSESESDDSQLQWIERTKETVEKERNSDSNKTIPYVRQWNENIRDLSKKPFDDKIISKSPNSYPNVEPNDNTVSELLKNHRGFSDNVNSWKGEPSLLQTSLNEDKRKTYDSNEDYDDEFDRGKTKKIKTTHKDDKFHPSLQNPFQKFTSEKNRFNGSYIGHQNRPDFNSYFKTNHNNNHKPWKSYDNKDSRRRH